MNTSPANPDSASDAAAHYQAALCAYTEGRYAQAVEILEPRLQSQPFDANIQHLRGLVAFALQQYEEALHWIHRAAAIQPSATTFNSLGAVYTACRDYENAIDSIQQGLALQPDCAILHFNAGLAKHMLGRFEEAAACYRTAISFEPEHSAAHNNLGLVLTKMVQPAKAEPHFRCAITLDPSNSEARSNLGHVLLKLGRFAEAWPYFEDRWVCNNGADGSPPVPRPDIPLPQWSSATDDPLAPRRHLLVFHEQGLGDALQFARYLPLVHERFQKVGYVCPAPLWRLFEDSFCSRYANLVLLESLPDVLTDWDWQCPLMSLPMAFDTRLETIPATIPYLHADRERIQHWHDRLNLSGESSRLPRVGLVWAGNPRLDRPGANAVDARRSLKASAYLPLLRVPGIVFVSLQVGATTRVQLTELPQELQPLDLMGEVQDFADTAAIIEHLDLVITVDTSVAHMAGALGKPVWILSRFDGCWRWLTERDDSPWYPSARLFRQTQAGDWDGVIERVTRALQLPDGTWAPQRA
ncbi:tetratricopeptide repeat protein [Paraburkholderia bonniea]|uniref:tetratricopeptide repeat protein n=1 Tax=Paraburkholderia bonniea TaxID=2152891 RepID=UPI001290F331|nr:tetratricopeptide repeat protein [Paraburkholderia bonniea]